MAQELWKWSHFEISKPILILLQVSWSIIQLYVLRGFKPLYRGTISPCWLRAAKLQLVKLRGWPIVLDSNQGRPCAACGRPNGRIFSNLQLCVPQATETCRASLERSKPAEKHTYYKIIRLVVILGKVLLSQSDPISKELIVIVGECIFFGLVATWNWNIKEGCDIGATKFRTMLYDMHFSK